MLANDVGEAVSERDTVEVDETDCVPVFDVVPEGEADVEKLARNDLQLEADTEGV